MRHNSLQHKAHAQNGRRRFGLHILKVWLLHCENGNIRRISETDRSRRFLCWQNMSYTSIHSRFFQRQFSTNNRLVPRLANVGNIIINLICHNVTGVDFKSKVLEEGTKRYKLQLWDTAGQERYNSLRRGFYRGAKVSRASSAHSMLCHEKSKSKMSLHNRFFTGCSSCI